MAKNSLSNTKINVTFQSLLHANGDPLPADGQEDIYDGSGNKSALKLGRSCNGATVCGPFVCGALSASDINVGNIAAGNIVANNITGTFNGINLMASTQFNLVNLCNVIYPVGAIILNFGVNPQTQFPGTQWTQVAQGRVLLGVGAHTDVRGTYLNYSWPGEHGGYYYNTTTYSVPHHRHVTGGFTEGGNDDWYPIWIGATAATTTAPYGGAARWVAGDSDRPNWKTDVWTTYGTGTGLPYSQETWGTPEFDVRNPAYAVYTWRRTS